MNRSSKRKSRQVKNPVTIYLAIVSIGSLCFVGVTSVMGWDNQLSFFAKPILLLCALLVVAYTLFALRLGSISSVGNYGQVHHYKKNKEPFFFFLLVIFYLVLSVPTALYMGYLMIWE